MRSSPRPCEAPHEHRRDRKRVGLGLRAETPARRLAAYLPGGGFRHAPRWAWRRAMGFSLIELTVVLLVLAILAAVVAIKLEGPAGQARMTDVADRIAAMDSTVRGIAETRDKPLRLVIDLDEGRLHATDGRNDVGSPCVLPDRFCIGAVRTRDGERNAGTVDIPVSRLGLTPTYAVRLEGPGGRKQWILVAGLSGERVEIDESELRTIIEPPQARLHAG